MFAFMMTFVLLYTVLSLYVLRWFKPAFAWKGRGTLAFLLFTNTMLALSIVCHVLDRSGYVLSARLAGMLGHLWMLALLWLVSFGFVAEIWNLLVFVGARFRPAVRNATLTPHRFVSGMGVVVAVLSVWGIVEARALRLETISIATERLPPGTRPLRILQISDLHFGVASDQRSIDRIRRLAQESKPDLVVCTGDLFDSPSAAMDPLARRLALLRPPLGKIACLGNHEYYVGLPRSLQLLREAGFLVLRDETVRLQTGHAGVIVAGADDPTASMIGGSSQVDERNLLKFEFLNDFTILLKHQPIVSRQSLGLFNLQLSGHTHGGQVFPFHFWVRLFYPHLSGFYRLGKESDLYVSPGAGTWGPPVRVLAPPKLTLFDIHPAG